MARANSSSVAIATIDRKTLLDLLEMGGRVGPRVQPVGDEEQGCEP